MRNSLMTLRKYLFWMSIDNKNGSILNKFGEICIWMSIIEERNFQIEWIWGNVYLEWVWIRKKGSRLNEVEEICFWMRILEEKGSTFIEFEELFIFNEFGWGKTGEICIWMSIIEERNFQIEWILGNIYLEWVWIRKKGSRLN